MAARLRRVSDPSPRWRLTLAAHGGAHWRSPDLVLAEVGGSLGWGPFFVRAGYQVPRDWNMSERPLRVSAVDLGAGWRRVVWTRRSWRLLLDVAVLLDRISLRRTDVAGASDHGFWDVGLGGGASLSRQLGHGLNLAVALNATVYLTGREVAITDGPSTRVNVVGLQPTLALSWEP